MTEAQGAGPPRWLAFVIRSTLLSMIVFVAAAYPFHAWQGGAGLLVLGIGAGLELVLIAISYAVLKASFERSLSAQYYAMLWGWVIRIVPTVAVLLVTWYGTDLPRVAMLAAVMIFYLTLLFYEAKVCWVVGRKS